MKKFRIISNGDKYRVQHRVKLGPLDFWRTDRFYEINASYPKTQQSPVEFEEVEKAEQYIRDQLAKTKPFRKKEPGRWKVVRKYSDKLGRETAPQS